MIGIPSRLTNPAVRFVLIRPGATDFDDQGRMKGCLDMPLSDCGHAQVTRVVQELSDVRFQTIFTAPCESAKETAAALAAGRTTKVKVVECFRNVDHGLWHGKLIEELRRNQPRIYRQGQESPDSIQPPGGETITQAKGRVLKAIRKVLKRSGDGAIALVIPDPLASVVQSLVGGDAMRNLWSAETDAAQWQWIEATMREPVVT